jgi:DNA-binding NarL/FixJ family response regulator
MSSSNRSDQERLARVVPRPWQRFLSSGEYAGAHASIQAGGSELPIDLAARLEFVDDRHLTIHLALASRQGDDAEAQPGPVHLLTARERAVITLIAMGRETEEIARALYVSPSTVRTHVRNSMAKVGAHTRAQLVAVVMGGEARAVVANADDLAADKSHT